MSQVVDFFSRVNWVDLVAWLLLGRSSYLGWRAGLTQEIVRVIGVIVAAVVAVQWYVGLSEAMGFYVNLPEVVLNLIAYASLVVGALIITGVARIAVERIVKFKFAAPWERPGGLVMGLLRGVVLVSVCLAGAMLARMDFLAQSITEQGYTGPALLKVAPAIHQALTGIIPAAEVENDLTVLAQ